MIPTFPTTQDIQVTWDQQPTGGQDLPKTAAEAAKKNVVGQTP
jgi:hypothetical protein